MDEHRQFQLSAIFERVRHTLEAVMQYAHRREKETPAHPSEPIDSRRLRALLNAFLEASRSGAALASCKAAPASLAALSPCA